MKYTVDDRGIHFEIEPEPIPLAEAVQACQKIGLDIEALYARIADAAATVDSGAQPPASRTETA